MADDLQAVIAGLAKAELHVHLEGGVRAACALQLAERHGLRLPIDEATGRWSPLRDFHDFIRRYLAVSACLQDEEDLELVIDDFARRCSAQRVHYAEVTFTPMTHIARGVDPRVLAVGLANGRALARARYNVELRWVFDIVRTFPDQAEPTLAFALEARRGDEQSVAGLGLGGLERESEDLTAFMPVFARAKAEGLKSLPHAGELAGARSIYAALTLLDADRIGHGIRCLEDPELVAILRDREIPLEVCPTSNVRLAGVPSLMQHPLPRLLEEGLCVCLASDDPGLLEFELADEYLACAQAFGWTPEQLEALANTSLRYGPGLPEALEADWDDGEEAPSSQGAKELA